MAVRGKYFDNAAIRLASEGIPFGPIQRALGDDGDLRPVLENAVRRGWLDKMPPDDWPEGSRFDNRMPARDPVAAGDLSATAAQIRDRLGYMHGTSMMLAAILIRGFVDRPTARQIVARKPPCSDKLVDVHAYHLRRHLAPYGIELRTVFGRGYRLTPAGIASVNTLLTDSGWEGRDDGGPRLPHAA